MTRTVALLLGSLLALAPALAPAAPVARGMQVEVEIHRVSKEGVGESIGTIRIARHKDGIYFDPTLQGLDPGLHGFHLHENGDCSPAEKDGEMTAAAAAGGHLNPDGEGGHNGPFEEGHLGDLPALYFDENGTAKIPVVAPRLEFDDLHNRALVIHKGGDNYSDDPEPLGGGGERVACGVISYERQDLVEVPEEQQHEGVEQPDPATPVNGQHMQVEMHRVSASGEGEFIGTILITNRLRGTLYEPGLKGLSEGAHAFHIHENPNCAPETVEPEEGVGPESVAAGAAGEHLDPGWTGNHSGPYGDGHVGDLPNLYVNQDGVAEHPVYAPRVKLADLMNRSLIIHAEPDHYSDEPDDPDFGGRIACGVVR